MFERFTKQARQVVISARDRARELGHNHIGTEHLLLALLDPDSGAPSRLLTEAGLTSDGVRAEIERLLGQAWFLSPEDVAALERIGIDVETVRAKIEESFGPGALEPEVPPTRYGLFGRKVSRGSFTPRTKKVLELALREAIRLKHNWIGTEHILLGLIREGDGLAAKIIFDAGIDLPALRRAMEESLRAAA
jgi:ATPases with chaperone activity, ATP-binding subunit